MDVFSMANRKIIQNILYPFYKRSGQLSYYFTVDLIQEVN
jgi:hypothetical protein